MTTRVSLSAISQFSLFHGAIIAGAAIAAVGAGVSAYGTAQNAAAVGDAADFAAYLENQLAKRQRAKLDTLITDKETKLAGINTILDRFQGGGAFGSSGVLENIRSAQSDFAALGAGDFSSFQDQLDNILKSTLANTYGSGAPDGTFTQLAADTVMNLRQGGLNTALTTGEFLSAESNRLLGAEFGIMDQEFENQYMIERNRVSGITGNMMISAQQEGVGTQAAGTALTQIGGLVTGVGGYFNQQGQINRQMDIAQQYADKATGVSSRPYSFTTPSITPVPSIRTGVGGGSGGGSGYFGNNASTAGLPTPYGAGSSNPFSSMTFSSPAPAGSLNYGYGGGGFVGSDGQLYGDVGVLPPLF
jgi:hypothetical protein